MRNRRIEPHMGRRKTIRIRTTRGRLSNINVRRTGGRRRGR